MLGAIGGDIIGSRHEFNPIKTTEFDLFGDGCRFTDDTVCTAAVADALLEGKDLEETLVEWVLDNVDAGYGLDFLGWALKPGRAPYGSWGNGSAMRVSSVAWLADDLAHSAEMAAGTAQITHDHHEGVRGAKAAAIAIRMALEGWSKEEIARVIEDRFGYDLRTSVDEIRPRYRFEVACHKSVPQALRCFLEADGFEHAVRLAVSLGGDADTQADIAGAVAAAKFGVPDTVVREIRSRVTDPVNQVVDRFLLRVDGRKYERSDLGRVPRDLPPPRRPEDDPFSSERLVAEMERIAVLERSVTAAKRRSPIEGLLRILSWR